MSDPNNPYGPPDPYGQQGSDPYGQQGANPYGQPGANPYGQPYGAGSFPGGPGGTPTKTDGVSIAALIVSFLCCFAPIGVILGFIGLGRTKNGQRKGRGLAIAAIIIGIVMSLATAAIAAVAIFAANSTVTPDNAEVGQCLNIREDGNTVYLTKKDCSDSHDGEIVHIGEYGDIADANLMPTDINDLSDAAISYAVCSQLMDAGDREKVDDPDGSKYTWGLALEDPENAEDDDKFVCYIEGDDLTSGIL